MNARQTKSSLKVSGVRCPVSIVLILVDCISLKQNNVLVLPSILYSIFNVKPRPIEHLIYIVVLPFCRLQLCKNEVQLIEDEQNMQLWIAFKIVIYFFLYHINSHLKTIFYKADIKNNVLNLGLQRSQCFLYCTFLF